MHSQLVSRLRKNFLEDQSPERKPPAGTTPPTSCPPTPPRPRLPKYFQPTPFLPLDSPPPLLPRHQQEYANKSDAEEITQTSSITLSPKMMHKTYMEDSSMDYDDDLPETLPPTFLSPKTLRKTYHSDYVSSGEEPDTRMAPSPKAVKKFDSKAKASLKRDNIVKPQPLVPVPKPQKLGKIYDPSNTDTKPKKVPPLISPKPVRRNLTDGYVSDSSYKPVQVSNAQINLSNCKRTESKKNVEILKKELQSYVKESEKSVKKLDEPPTMEEIKKSFLTPKFHRRKNIIGDSAKDSLSVTHTVPQSPKFLRRKNFWRDISVSSEEGGSDSGLPPSGTKGEKRKKSGGLKLFRKMREKLSDIGFPGIDECCVKHVFFRLTFISERFLIKNSFLMHSFESKLSV